MAVHLLLDFRNIGLIPGGSDNFVSLIVDSAALKL